MKSALLTVMTFVLCANFAIAQTGARSTAPGQEGYASEPHIFTASKWDYFLYPVPAVDVIYVKVTKGYMAIHQVNITDEFGNDVLEIRELNTAKLEIDISELPEGTYFMQIIPDDKSSLLMKRFFVEN